MTYYFQKGVQKCLVDIRILNPSLQCFLALFCLSFLFGHPVQPQISKLDNINCLFRAFIQKLRTNWGQFK